MNQWIWLVKHRGGEEKNKNKKTKKKMRLEIREGTVKKKKKEDEKIDTEKAQSKQTRWRNVEGKVKWERKWIKKQGKLGRWDTKKVNLMWDVYKLKEMNLPIIVFTTPLYTSLFTKILFLFKKTLNWIN